jgi:hypothetical protein
MSVEGSSNKTIRVQKKRLASLLKDSERSGISLDRMVDRILADHSGWDEWADKAGFVPMHKTIIKQLFDGVDEGTVRRLAADLARESRSINFMLAGADNFESSLEVFKKMIRKSGFQIQEFANEKKFLIQHGMGTNSSIFYAALFSKLARDQGRRSKIYYTENTLSVHV